MVLEGSPVFIAGTALSMAAAGGCAPSVPTGAFISGVAASMAFVGASSPGFVGAGVAVGVGAPSPDLVGAGVAVAGVVVAFGSFVVLEGSPVFIEGTALSMAAAGGCAPSVPPGAFMSGVAESMAFVGASSPGFVGAGVAVGVGASFPDLVGAGVAVAGVVVAFGTFVVLEGSPDFMEGTALSLSLIHI